MNKYNHPEKIISQVFSLMESGKSAREIVALLPEHETEVTEIFQVFNLLASQKKGIKPSKELLLKIITDLPIAKIVTEKEVSRYLYRNRGEQASSDFAQREGRPSEISIKTKIHNHMNINWKVWAPLGIVAVVALIIIGSYQSGTKTPQVPSTGRTPQAQVPVAIKPATGNVDDTVNTILAGASDDQALFADAEKDAALIDADSQAISDFGQSYNENEF